MNHEFSVPWNFNSFYLRTLVYAEHIRQGDWFPIWAVSDNEGFGSPQPLLYHKLFYWISGHLFAWTGVMKASLIMSIWIFLLVGATGMFRLCREMGCTFERAGVGSLLLMLSNYTVANWLIRGAMAEFGAAMLVPWLLSAYLSWVKHRMFEIGKILKLSILAGLMFLAHSVLAYYLILLLIFLSLVTYWVADRKAENNLLNGKNILVFGAVFWAMTGPFIFMIKAVSQSYDMKRIIPAPFLPENQIKSLFSYLWDPAWQWGQAWDSYTVQLDTPVMSLLFVGIIGSWMEIQKKPTAPIKVASGSDSRGVCVLNISLLAILVVFLQTRWAIPFYRAMPGAAYIQFPWRLLGVLTPCLIGLSLAMVGGYSLPVLRLAPWVALMAAIGVCGAWKPLHYGSIPKVSSSIGMYRFSAFGEYIPIEAGINPSIGRDVYEKTMTDLGCRLREEIRSSQEHLKTIYFIECDRPGTIPLPLFKSPWHQGRVLGGEIETGWSSCSTYKESPALCAITIAGSGLSRVEILFPTVHRAWEAWIKALKGD